MATPQIDLAPTMGAIFVGIAIAIFLTGIATMQAWNYFRTYSGDRVAFKAIVSLIFIADVVHTILLVSMAYHYLILSFGDLSALEHLTPLWPVSVLIGSMIEFSVQTFSCVRIYFVGGSKAVAIACWILALLHEIFSNWLVIKLFKGLAGHAIQDLSMNLAREPLISSLALGAAADISIAASLCFGMLGLTLSPGWDDVGTVTQRKRIVDRLIAFIVASGLLTSIGTLCEMIVYLTMDNLVYLAFYAFAAKIYVNAVLASLNERTYLRAEMQSNPESPIATLPMHSDWTSKAV